MKTVLKHIVARTYKPWLVKYLSKTRVYRYAGIRLEIPPQVFHPGFFSSTGLLLQYITAFHLPGKKILELGAGSGLISMYAARAGAKVTASDINPIAIEYLTKNSEQNKIKLAIILSDLFKNIPPQSFDLVIINPPYYKKEPQTFSDHAWFCGKNGEYFDGLFSQLANYLQQNSEVIMILSEGCDIKMIEEKAFSSNFRMHCSQIKKTILEKNFIYKIEPVT
jgi:release factor glutamine methyltransferase